VQVVVQQPGGGGLAVCGVVGGGQRAGVLAEQVMQQVAARRRLAEQVLVIQLFKVAVRGGQAGAIQRGGGVRVEGCARDQAEPTEQPLRAGG
jgi:hypothetical protein